MMQPKIIFRSGVMALVAMMLPSSTAAQPVPPGSSNACIVRTAEEMGVPTREVVVDRAGRPDPENGVRILFMRNTRTRQTAECRVGTIDNTVLSVKLTGNAAPPPPSGGAKPPTQGSFLGKGKASNSVFGSGRNVDASLDFNKNGFSVRLFVPPGTGVQTQHQGKINRIRGTNSRNSNSFIIEGSLESFATSTNNLRVIKARGDCKIEVFDSRITSVFCTSLSAGGSVRFTGMKQF
jgi:hypothetical protein